MPMYRPDKKYFGIVTGKVPYRAIRIATGGYWWYYLENMNLSKAKNARVPAWDKDGQKIYYTCPYCSTINKSVAATGDGKYPSADVMINGRDLDTVDCEVCSECQQHVWLTFAGIVDRKTAGAIKLRPNKCLSCKKETQSFEIREDNFRGTPAGIFMVEYYWCCKKMWRIK